MSASPQPITECDVLVVGSGAAGFAAALTARHHGLDVLMAEKEPVFGGTTAYSAGVVWIPGNAHARRAGIADTREAALTYLRHEVGNRLDEAKAGAFVRAAADMLDFFETETHVRFGLVPTWADYHPTQPGGVDGGRSLLPESYDGRRLGAWFGKLRPPLATTTILGGMMVGRDDIPHLFKMTRSLRSAAYVAKLFARYAADRTRHPRGTRLSNGNALIARLAQSALERDIPLWLSSPVTRLLVDGGRVAGAEVSRDGATVVVHARRGVILACGGFPGGDDLRQHFDGALRPDKYYRSLAPATNTGDGIRLAQAAGGRLDGNVHHHVAWTPVSLVPQPGGGTIPFPHFIDRGKPGYIAVDRRGRRFVNEALSYHDFVPALMEACRDDAAVEGFILCDHTAVRRFGLGMAPPAPGRLRPHLRSGYIASGATLSELAGKLGIDPSGLAATVSAYNEGARRGQDPAFGKGRNAYERFNGAAHGRGANPNLAPIEAGPFYGVRVIPGDLGTFAGLSTDARARVLDEAGAIIQGLWAVGNDMASVMGGTYPGAGITIGPAMTFGYLAGLDVAGEREERHASAA